MKIVFVVLFLLVNSVSGQPQTGQQVPFVRVDRIGDVAERSFFVFSTSYRDYAIRHDGHGEGSSTTVMRKNFDLRMGGAGRLERLYFAEYDGDLFLEYEVTDLRGDWGYLLRMDQKMMKLRWIVPLSSNNLGPGLIDGEGIYFSAANLLAKVDLTNGSYLWQQNQTEHTWAFGLPELKGQALVFHDAGEIDRSVEVDKPTGRLIKH